MADLFVPKSSSESLVYGGKVKFSASCSRTRSLAVGGIFFSVAATTTAVLLACGIVNIAIIISLALSVVALGIMLVTSWALSIKSPIPEGFLNVIKEAFPPEVYQFVVRKKLTIHELRATLSWLSSGEFICSERCRKKIESFGAEKLKEACKGVDIPNLDDLLNYHCPFSFIKKFIELGNKEACKESGFDPRLYWTARIGLAGEETNVVFDPCVWILSEVITEKEYELLCQHAQNDTWDLTYTFVCDLQKRMLSYLESIDSKNLLQSQIELQNKIRHPAWLICLCRHGVNWDQIQLCREIGISRMSFLYEVQRFCELSYPLLHFFSYTYEDHEDYDPGIALFTWDDWKEEHKKIRRVRRLWYDAIGITKSLGKYSKKPRIGKGCRIILEYNLNIPGSEYLRFF
ncbi:DUF1389 domain-containing protein [Chlamydia vaughanii]|uniref:DUF1389 domain-containing protein n=1 Tax=Chlamydia vaughanii TaxID=3112552 RepID=UPI0032B0FB47